MAKYKIGKNIRKMTLIHINKQKSNMNKTQDEQKQNLAIQLITITFKIRRAKYVKLLNTAAPPIEAKLKLFVRRPVVTRWTSVVSFVPRILYIPRGRDGT
jgi:hypothetical protein